MPENDLASVVPAQLSFLAIYNPRLGPTDETIRDQVVFYTSRSSRSRRREGSAAEDGDQHSNDYWNEILRQIGLAQGMVGFARNFSQGKAVDYVETEKSQIILHELEKDWWILASVDLTRLPLDQPSTSSSQRDASYPSFSYSSREMSPPALLIQQLRRAHSVFLLHHDSTLDALYSRVGRPTFCALIENFWWRFSWTWEVLLSGNPAVDIYNGIKLSAGGELGIGVGEEEWGSGEREVLEDFVARTDGLMDLIVSRFGDPESSDKNPAANDRPGDLLNTVDGEDRWLGSGACPRPADGVIFSGIGGVSRPSLLRISQWMESIYRYGADAYGVGEDPSSPRRRKRRRKHRSRLAGSDPTKQPVTDPRFVTPDRPFSPGIPPPLVVGTAESPQAPQKSSSHTSGESSPVGSDRGNDWMGFRTETFVKYLTLGYGSSWGVSSGTASPHPRVEAIKREDRPMSPNKQTDLSTDAPGTIDGEAAQPDDGKKIQSHGKFLIGLRSDSDDQVGALQEGADPTDNQTSLSDNINHRRLHIQLSESSEQVSAGLTELQAVVYVHQPFIYTFLFDPATPTLSDPTLYQSIIHQLSPLHKPLSNSTSPATAELRISMFDNALDINKRFSGKSQPVYNLVYDQTNLTIRSSIPNIPDLGSTVNEPRDPATHPWSRVESLNIHHRLLSTHLETRSRPLEVERTCKTSRGWWIVWIRMSEPSRQEQGSTASNASVQTNTELDTNNAHQEAFIVRRSSDSVSPSGHARNSSSTRFFRDLGGASSPGLQASRTDTGPGKLVEGLGLDARRYIENLLSLNR
ncbi:oligosaccharide biosynthesis protein Alg14 like family protein [Aspergillus niger]|uniref:uncharacterized protein n=1 Tax=Aspergillus lacticoffeatus (strain CBS 101883) TaxID=1450533 RepID=UPI000D7F24E9|nr:uncharacterized protein BO96DRAFT_367502 [Aspergillus niger CBS 101883]PYH56502.1 hypothetical protein BO96DRAFT_367502 [Aspergillus niger CBS 101883]GJP98102.1 oligosaccharide biosynthesis protein Alg14 like family protein [Aspergillus niger]